MIAFTRAVSPRIAECELSFLEREPIDPVRAAAQHDEYERALVAAGCRIVHIEEAPDHPDGVFVEDAAVILDRFAVITRPGAESRRGETDSVARALEPYLPLRRIEAPATIDGGDVMVIGHTIYVGRSARTNDAAIDQLRRIATGYDVIPIDFQGCLHLKSAVTAIGDRTLLANPDWVDVRQFAGFDVVAVEEPHAANALLIGPTLLVGSAYVRTRRALETRGYAVQAIDITELAKAEAGVTCCSLVCLYC